MSGSYTSDDFNETFHTTLPTEGHRTLGGLVFGELGRAPRRGDGVTVAGVELAVEQTEGPRIDEAARAAAGLGPDLTVGSVP